MSSQAAKPTSVSGTTSSALNTDPQASATLGVAGCAYVLMHALRRLGLQGTALEHAQATTIRLKLLKLGARIRITARKVWLSLAESLPLQALFAQAWRQLSC